jgi:SAM-dependent methyltransferase
MTTKHLDIGCGSNPRNPFNCDELHAIDIVEQIDTSNNQIVPNDAHASYGRKVIEKNPENFHYRQGNAALDKLPFDDNSFDSVSAYDFIEHIPRLITESNNIRFPFVEFMNEAYRVLKPDGIFYAITPCYPRDEIFVDPTHVNFITKGTYEYFTLPTLTAEMYGFNGQFEVVRVKRIFSRLEKREKSLSKFLKNILYTVISHTKKSHIVWEFRAVKK